MAGFALGMLGVPASLDGAVINADGFVAVVAAECTAIELILVFGAAVIVWPVSLRARIWALLMGVPALCVLNFARVVSLLFTGISFPEHFDMVHLKVWQRLWRWQRLGCGCYGCAGHRTASALANWRLVSD